jgi:hypothetical protein
VEQVKGGGDGYEEPEDSFYTDGHRCIVTQFYGKM